MQTTVVVVKHCPGWENGKVVKETNSADFYREFLFGIFEEHKIQSEARSLRTRRASNIRADATHELVPHLPYHLNPDEP